MARKKASIDYEIHGRSSVEADEEECIALAYRLAKQQLRDGTASASTLNYFLNRNNSDSDVNRRLKEKQIDYTDTKIKSVESIETEADIYQEAINAFRGYQGRSHDD